MTSEDPPPSGSPLPKDRSPRLLVGVGLVGILALAGLAFYLGRITGEAPEPIATPTTDVRPSTTTTAPSPATSGSPIHSGSLGEPVTWEQVGSLDEAFPFSLVSHDGLFYLFGWTEEPSRTRFPDVTAWVSRDGSDWEEMGAVMGDVDAVHSVVSTQMGLVGFSFGESATFFHSSDGQQWTAVDLPVETTGSDFQVHAVRGAAATRETMVVFSSTHFDIEGAVVDALPDELKPGDEFFPYGMGFSSPPFVVTVHGPLGLTVFRATAQELGLDDEEIAALEFGGRNAASATAWSSSDLQTWTGSGLDVDHIQSVTISEEGDFWAFGYGEFGPSIWTSADGVEWSERDLSRANVDVRTLWNDYLIGIRHRGPVPEVVFSTDGEEWESFGVEDLLPEDRFWDFQPLPAGSTGLAILAISYDESGMEHGPDPVTLDREGFTLTFDDMRGSLILDKDGEEILDLFIHSEQIHEEIEVDFAARTVAFLDPANLDPLVSFSFDELEEAQAMAFADGAMGEELQFLLFSTDGETWSVQDLNDAFGPDAGLPMFAVSDDRIVAVVPEQVDFLGETLPDLAVWIGTP